LTADRAVPYRAAKAVNGMLAARIDRAEVLGVDIGGTKIALSAWDASGGMIGKERFETPATPDEAIDRIAESFERLRSTVAGGLRRLKAAGISCGGPLDEKAGLILSPPNLPGWDEVPIAAELERITGVPSFLENDANACALAEWRWGAGRGLEDLVFLTFGTGLGAGLILGGRLRRGTSGSAGEVGHVRIASYGPPGYGKRGSWEGFCSGGGIERAYREETGREATAEAICGLARSGEAPALRVIEASAERLGEGIAILMDILNPGIVVIGSVFARAEDLFRPRMEEAIAREALPAARSACAVAPAGLGELLGDMAARCVAMEGMRNARDR
jgi:glucokinase